MNVTLNRSEQGEDEAPGYRFGSQVHSYRLAAGKSQAQVAMALGVSPTRVNAIERGRTIAPGANMVDKLHPVLGLTDKQVELLRVIAMRDRVLLGAARSGMDKGRLNFLAASLDAAVVLGNQELQALSQGLAEQVAARRRTARFIGEPTLVDMAA